MLFSVNKLIKLNMGEKSLFSSSERKSQLFFILKVNVIFYLLFDYGLNIVVLFFVENIAKHITSRYEMTSNHLGLDYFWTQGCLYASLGLSIILDIIGLIGVIKNHPFLSLLNVCQLSIGILKVVVIYNYLPLITFHMLFVVLSLIFSIGVMPEDGHLFIT